MDMQFHATFEGPTGILTLNVERYQFPEIVDDEWDSNWLVITGNATLNGKSWQFCDPCLTTFELASLVEWLGQVTSGSNVKKNLFFTEPNLDFENISDEFVWIRFWL